MQISLISIISDYHIIVSTIFVLIAWRWGDWKNWKTYYPTILFFITGNFLYDLLTYNYPLWAYESPLLKTTFSDLLFSFVFFPATILLYLPHFPKGLVKQAVYVLFSVIIYTIVEIVSYSFEFFSYHHGWSICWSVLFNIIMFPTLRLHHKKPPLAWFISFLVAAGVLFYFNVPFSSMK